MEAHNVIRFKKEGLLTDDWPAWFLITDELYATVRRDVAKKGFIPVGLRGQERYQRFAFELPIQAVEEVIHPWELTLKESFRQLEVSDYPVYQLYHQVRSILKGCTWGVGGSLGFELATRQPTIKATSDFDLLLYTKEAAELPKALIQQYPEFFGALDTQVITLKGGFALKEYMQNPEKKILLKTTTGPILTNDLW